MEYRPCPFDGKQPVVVESTTKERCNLDDVTMYKLKCESCYLKVETYFYLTLREAKMMWDNRAL